MGLTACGSTVSVTAPGTTTVAASSAPTTSTPSGTSAAAATGAAFTQGQRVTGAQLIAATRGAMEKAGTAHVGISSPAGMTAEGAMRLTGATPAMELSVNSMSIKMSVIAVDGAMYLKMPMLGEKYLKVDPKGTDPLSRRMAPSLQQMNSSMRAPLSSYGQSLPWVVSQTSAAGTTLTAHATGDDLRSAMAQSGSVPSGVPTRSITGEMVITLTLDGHNLPERTVVMMNGKQVLTQTYSQWGEPVTITAPPTSQVTTAPQDLGSLGA